jgi:hypothetical protein
VLGGFCSTTTPSTGSATLGRGFQRSAPADLRAHQLAAEAKPADVVTVSESLASVKLDYRLAYLGALVKRPDRRVSVTTRTSCATRSCASSRIAGDIAIRRRSVAARRKSSTAKVLHSRTRQYEEIGKLLAGAIETLYNRDDPSDVTGA